MALYSDYRVATGHQMHPKFHRLWAAGPVGAAAYVGWHALLDHCASWSPMGQLGPEELVAQLTKVGFTCPWADPQEVAQLLLDSGLIDPGQPATLHDWPDHQGGIVDRERKRSAGRAGGIAAAQHGNSGRPASKAAEVPPGGGGENSTRNSTQIAEGVAEGVAQKYPSLPPSLPPSHSLPPTVPPTDPPPSHVGAADAAGDPKPRRAPIPIPEDFLPLWNQTAEVCRWTKAIALNPKRTTRLRNLLANPGWRESWRFALERMRENGGSAFLRGEDQPGRENPWRANVDWFLKAGTVLEIAEGRWDPQDTLMDFVSETVEGVAAIRREREERDGDH